MKDIPNIWLDCAYYGRCNLKSEYEELVKMVCVCRDINDSGEEYCSPNADAAQALANLFSLVDTDNRKDKRK